MTVDANALRPVATTEQTDAEQRTLRDASAAGGEVVHPRPQLTRRHWVELGGDWLFAVDDDDRGRRDGWHTDTSAFDRTITVPFPPEAVGSGIADTGFHPVVWYQRVVTRDDLSAAGHGDQGDRVLLHFGAVDYVADVWLAGQHVGRHEGGSTPFHFDVTPLLGADETSWSLVVRAEDDPHDVSQPRGKQDWQFEPHGIWYQRTTGIWQPVWLEAVPTLFVTDVAWTPDASASSVLLSLELDHRPTGGATVFVAIDFEGRRLADVAITQWQPRSRTVIDLPAQSNGQAYETLLWSPDHPRLLDVTVTVTPLDSPDGSDVVQSYLGLRSVGWSHGHVMLNDRPCYIRAILAQGYWPETHLAAPSADALREEVLLIKSLGFNAVRVHQKIEDPRFLYWCDRLGLLVWAEGASAYEFSVTAVERMTREWMDVIRRDVSHPSVMAWVPLNESWGVQHIGHDPRQLSYAQMLYHLTKTLDPSRPVITNDGWQHADSDIWTIHDYSETGAELEARYTDKTVLDEMMAGLGPLGRRMKLLPGADRGQPHIVSEFGGVSFAPTHAKPAWGYTTASEASAFETALRELFSALQRSPVLAGFCYTQLSDTDQEANGLTDPHRRPKLPVETIRSIVLGEGVDLSGQRRPRHASEHTHTGSPST